MLALTVVSSLCVAAFAAGAGPAGGGTGGGAAEPERLEHRGNLAIAVESAAGVFLANPDDTAARLGYAELLYEFGDFEHAMEVVGPLVQAPDAAVEAMTLAARIEYLRGSYEEAERLLKAIHAANPDDVRVLSKLALVYYVTDEYARSRDLPADLGRTARLPHFDLMAAFDGKTPYRIAWKDGPRTTVPFLATDPLPIVPVRVEGQDLSALIDTGADCFILDSAIAESLGIEIVAEMTGMFAGGLEARVGFGIADSLTLGGVTLYSVPVSVLPTRQFAMGGHATGGIVGTSVLRQFLSTLDYPRGELILRERSEDASVRLDEEIRGRVLDETPFYLQGTHFLMARGSLNGFGNMVFHVDSGLAGEPSCGAPRQTLEYVGIPIPEVSTDGGAMGGGGVVAVGQFPVAEIALGDLKQHDLLGSYGPIPPESYKRLGFIQDGLVSHGFLRQYAWTIDFDRMRMVFTR